ncbi:cell division protein ZapD [Oceanisphaera profunda]|uniref:Cell division protein ZapD n=1 Tax=Oceanisphaera profunda TaxID=1416627 RepID=A0A1Y0D4L9_9GAMM|nr:cell division protein ZapD [Oceanisphaera profunda]ART82055.1 cell division protein ZapD [Oceanisphaera profunda]
MSALIYEYPLNEKCRNYLRLSDLLLQIKQCRSLSANGQAVALFKALLDIIELLERCDIRSDLAKDLNIEKEKLAAWAEVPGIDVAALSELEQQLADLSQQLPRSPRFGQLLREDKLLVAVRSRFAIPGGLCSFDVPQLHYWLHQPKANQQQDIDGWLSQLQLLQQGLELQLTLWRDVGQFQPQIAHNGFFQDDAAHTHIIRVRVPADQAIYPVVSGNKYRYTVRFMPVDNHDIGNVEFELANIK